MLLPYRYRRRLAYWKFDRVAGGILDTPPMPVVRPERCTIVSMVRPRDILMYLVSMKAFYRRIGGGRIVAIVDRDTPRSGYEMLARHLPGIEFQVLEDIDVGPCQRGGTLERILYILDRAEQGEYVVQVDADVMPTGPDIAELVRCVETRTAFTMADGATIIPVREAAAFARTMTPDYIGDFAEGLFDRMPDADELRYVRGSSGLAGFAPGGFPRRRIEAFHREMEALVGPARWREWGTEQCASNFAVANTPGGITLPYPQYTSFHPGCDRTVAKMYHFIGTYRFDEGVFAGLARAEITALKGEAAPLSRVA
ncbi:hypothetical protein [Paracraurococcus lichenis]|uniref:Glycosyltransferase n=1 Tax=Paracraurococcus lichenis TaxID=3064888 RepID=A0ABT9EA98_9PROT|nr:hypothetical protein [Paracraurococcus sp. LOR1-02]MDO9713103.1 hypothetical protein [Paracraurococcus sp. LOR1-02]